MLKQVITAVGLVLAFSFLVQALQSDKTLTDCFINDGSSDSTCTSAISADGGSTQAVNKNAHLDAPFDTLSDVTSVSNATLYYDHAGIVSGTWSIHVTETRDGTVICENTTAQEHTGFQTHTLDCSSITPTQLGNGVWLKIVGETHGSAEAITIDYVYLEVNYIGDTDSPNTTLIPPTAANNSIITTNFTIINASITNSSDLDTVIFDWNNTNYTLFDAKVLLYYSFNNISEIGENSTSVVDVSTYNRASVKTDNVTYAYSDSRYGKSAHFNRSSYINITNTTDFDSMTAVSFFAWVKSDESLDNGQDTILGRTGTSNGWMGFYEKPSNGFKCKFSNSTTTAESEWVITADFELDWHFVGCVYDGSTLTSTVDGTFTADTPALGGALAGDQYSLLIGEQDRTDLPNPFVGVIDELIVFNRALTESEVLQLYKTNLKKYDIDKWELFINQTNLTDGDYSYQIIVNDTSNNINKTPRRFITINTTVTSSCTCPGSDSDWEVDLSDECVITSLCDIGTGKITYTSTGRFRNKDVIKTGKGMRANANQGVIISEGGQLIVT